MCGDGRDENQKVVEGLVAMSLVKTESRVVVVLMAIGKTKERRKTVLFLFRNITNFEKISIGESKIF